MAYKWLQRASQNGDPNSLLWLGLCFEEGGKGVEQNSSKALELFKRAADKGNVVAQFHLGVLHKEGFGVKKDLDLAEKSFLQFFNCSKIDALLEKWKEKSTQETINMFRMGYILVHNLGPFSETNVGESVDENGNDSLAQGIRLIRLAAEKQYSPARIILADCYEQGRGVERDREKAIHWLQRAKKENGNKNCQLRLDPL
eukprot:TRINITY_DN3833_c0_g5_i1.p1 TRINITY_DN3833_c0_g5~~TRINITY_DN3833_c0_g5_i1.p1  ORF type:complete len:221 (-),score=76.84 TRINITY_DN3833_c0_g5_i1:24-623(-)